jgi:tetratricopeptide (TPR) repeat protein
MRLLDAFEQHRREDLATSQATLEEVFRTDPDPLVGHQIEITAVVRQQLDDASAVARRCHELYPDLWFAVDLAECYQRSGRERDGERVIRDSVAQRPENPSTAVALIRLESAAARVAEAVRHTANLRLLHGERPAILSGLFDALVASEQLFAAQRIAERMLLGSALERARGRYRMAVVAVMEGKFATALNGARRAIDENRPFGAESELTQCLELARSLTRMIGDTAGERAFGLDLAGLFGGFIGDVANEAALRFDVALLDSTDCQIEDHLGKLGGAERDHARTQMLRSAGGAGRVSDRDVVAAGFTANEANAGSLIALGISARRVGELELARRSFEMAVPLWSSMLSNVASPVDSILARYHLAGVLAETGDVAGARAQYEAFLRRWSSADRPVSEVALARRAVAAL